MKHSAGQLAQASVGGVQFLRALLHLGFELLSNVSNAFPALLIQLSECDDDARCKQKNENAQRLRCVWKAKRVRWLKKPIACAQDSKGDRRDGRSGSAKTGGKCYS